ncbi:MAG TPA: hypothetical protein DG942_03225 [Ruminococcaceae bacterium]|nr:hypothetical protein [Oscillospiraceae bacterium]
MAKKKRPSDVKSGYEKLAYGKVNDAVRLMFRNGLDPSELRKLDLYSVAELKQTKDGLEIKFYDRMKALECLKKMEESGAEQSPLYRALIESVSRSGEAESNGA